MGIEEEEAWLIDMWRIADAISIEEPEMIARHTKVINETIERLKLALKRAEQES